MNQLIIVMNDPKDHDTINTLAGDLSAALGEDVRIDKSFEQTDITDKIKKLVNNVFYGLIAITMFLCFFSLAASMSANLYE